MSLAEKLNEELADEQRTALLAKYGRNAEEQKGGSGDLLPFVEAEPPEPPEIECFYGLAGDIVQTISPYSEADDIALLINLLAGFGNIIGRGPHFIAGADKHFTNLFVALVGDTGKGRKGMSWGWVRQLLAEVDDCWTTTRCRSGLSSGEGLIDAVRDEVISKDKKGEEIVVLSGYPDKRLLVIEPELASALKVMSRQGNSLSPKIREAWDSLGLLETMTRNNPLRATNPHISIIGHITKDELKYALTHTEYANGFANRFLWIYSKRSKFLPGGLPLPNDSLFVLAEKLSRVISYARTITTIRRDENANELWRVVYPRLSSGKPGLSGAVIARSEAMTMRLAMLYALLDLSAVIRIEHLTAGLALWEYSEASCRYIFGESGGGPVESEILNSLKEGPLKQDAIYKIFDGRVSAEVYKSALSNLYRQGLITSEKLTTGKPGRPPIEWRLIQNG